MMMHLCVELRVCMCAFSCQVLSGIVCKENPIKLPKCKGLNIVLRAEKVPRDRTRALPRQLRAADQQALLTGGCSMNVQVEV